MDGPKIFKTAAKYFNNFLELLLKKANVSLQDINFVIPHQASYHGIKHIQKHLGIKQDKVICIIENYGNQVAASVPNALYELTNNKQLQKGNKILFLGAAAGLILGGLILEY
ncbi:MAG: 3-oxoacyl-[acyl-carrier-protein] synthase III C-terminal domain-containing protein [Wolbachia endosymbiont of Tyrophagus putrescentiae]|nr:3-oxoacyl-[acyl-carrier-protein] synthase III C-terminal domain-containing protein [Wolbachia endosymbiont of Tyrophagus putrescentiae]